MEEPAEASTIRTIQPGSGGPVAWQGSAGSRAGGRRTRTAGSNGGGLRAGAAGSESIAGSNGSAGSGSAAGATGSGGLGVGGSNGAAGASGCSPVCAPSAYCNSGTCKSRFTEFSIRDCAPILATSRAVPTAISGSQRETTQTVLSAAASVVCRERDADVVPHPHDKDPNSFTVRSVGIVRGPDGNIWFDAVTGDGKGYISTATTSGVVTNYQFSMTYPTVGRVAVGPDGNIWAAIMNLSPSGGSNKVEICTTSGSISEQTLPGYSSPYGIVAGSDGNVWFTETLIPRELARKTLTGVGDGVSDVDSSITSHWVLTGICGSPSPVTVPSGAVPQGERSSSFRSRPFHRRLWI